MCMYKIKIKRISRCRLVGFLLCLVVLAQSCLDVYGKIGDWTFTVCGGCIRQDNCKFYIVIYSLLIY